MLPFWGNYSWNVESRWKCSVSIGFSPPIAFPYCCSADQNSTSRCVLIFRMITISTEYWDLKCSSQVKSTVLKFYKTTIVSRRFDFWIPFPIYYHLWTWTWTYEYDYLKQKKKCLPPSSKIPDEKYCFSLWPRWHPLSRKTGTFFFTFSNECSHLVAWDRFKRSIYFSLFSSQASIHLYIKNRQLLPRYIPFSNGSARNVRLALETSPSNNVNLAYHLFP